MTSRQPTCSSFSSLTAFILFNGLVIIFMTILTTNTNATISSSSSSSYDYGNETDQLALLSFKSLITHDPYGVLTSWNTSLHFCDWTGVTCGKRHKRVIVLRLQSQGLEGSLSPHVANLSFLRELSLLNNSFQKTIPHEVGRLLRLRVFDLEANNFNGVIPTNLSGWSNLEMLWLGTNELVGSIPKEISLLQKLTILSVDENRLTGGIPPFLGNMTSLEMMAISDNPFGGTIPDMFGRLKSLKVLYLDVCNLSGTIPHSIYNLSLLSELTLFKNQLTGSLPPAIAMFPDVTLLRLWGNQLTGFLPPSISNCSKLTELGMSYNSFSGKLTIDFSKLTYISWISLGNNNFGSGEMDDMKFIDSLKNCSKLDWLSLTNCNFEGVLPKSIGNLSHELSALDLSRNKLYGKLSLISVSNLVGLTTLNLASNRLTGKIPSAIGKLQKLQVALLHENRFSGPIPNAIGNLSRIIKLVLRSNNLEGVIPSSLGNCYRLEALDLHDNRLTGNIPKQLLQLSSISIAFDLSQNNLFGSLPSEVGDLKMLTLLNLSNNNLSGNIPSSLSGCTSLSYLYLNENLFQGMLPSSLSAMRGLVELDLSRNNLSGQIPRFLEGFFLQELNMSFNNFEGEVPVKGVFSNASAISIMGNRKLCGGLVELKLPKCKEKKNYKRFPLFVIVLLIASSLLVVSCVVYVLYKKKRKGQQPQSSTNERFLKVSYDQLLKATNGFSKANLIGKGGSSSVYKGLLEHDDKFVAVKVLHLQTRGAHKNFVRECEAWQSVRHRNLLKIITSCSSVDFQGNDFKALVYEFMPNGSLHDWLHSTVHASRLNLLQRINILIDIASALDYLHNFCVATIAHCDLKPSNILLDDDMVAHVGDFGLARFLGTNVDLNSTSRVKGTIGYAPPEYGLGSEMTSSGDVYSFGILLLEVMTGKYPTQDTFNECLSLHKFVSRALVDHAVTDVIDSDAITLQSTESNAKKVEEFLTSTLKIGLSCSVDSPTQRMKIENVVRELHHIKDVLQNI